MKQSIRRRIAVLLLLTSLMFVLFTRTHKFLVVDGDSMYPTLHNGDICLLETVVAPTREGIYVIQEPDADQWAVKRLIGTPMDDVVLINGDTYVNGEQILSEVNGSWESTSFHMNANEYLFLGDNRTDSYDGRYWSRPVNRGEILYRVVFRIKPISRAGSLE